MAKSMIGRISDELLRDARNEYLEIVTSTARADRDRSEAIISEMYALVGEDRPTFYWVSSPREASEAFEAMGGVPMSLHSPINDSVLKPLSQIHQYYIAPYLERGLSVTVREMFSEPVNRACAVIQNAIGGSRPVVNNRFRTSRIVSVTESGPEVSEHLWMPALPKIPDFHFYGQHAGMDIAMAVFFMDKMNLKTIPDNDVMKISLWDGLSRACGWWWPYQGVCLVSERTTESHLRDDSAPHCDGGPAIVYEDGFCAWIWGGVVVSQHIAETPEGELDPKMILNIKNVDIRRVVIEKVGIDRVFISFNSEMIDKENDYELHLLDLDDGRRRPYLKMLNPSVGVWHVEGVHPSVTTVKDALAWRNGTDTSPEILT